MIHRQFSFDIKAIGDDGTFEGIASVYNNVDLGGDRVKPGAFTKTLQDNGGRVPLLLDHRIPIGIAHLSDTENGLKTQGKLNLGKRDAEETYSDLKFYQSEGTPYGMSIGYETIKSVRGEDGVRDLTEIKLYEVSATLFPMNQAARIQLVKSHDQFIAAIERLNAKMDELHREPSLESFATYLKELKIGRTISAANMAKIQSAVATLLALIEEAAAESDTSKSAAQPSPDEPVSDHSQLDETTKTQLKELVSQWTFKA